MRFTKRALLLNLLIFVIGMICYPGKGKTEYTEDSYSVFDPETGITTYYQTSYTNNKNITINQDEPIPIERRSYISVSLSTSVDGAGGALAEFGRRPRGSDNFEVIKSSEGSSTWTGTVSIENYDYYIHTWIYSGWLWGCASAEATVIIYPYFNLSISNSTSYGKVEAYERIFWWTLVKSSFLANWSCEYRAGKSAHLTASPNPGYSFIRWEGDVTGTSTTSPTFIMNKDKAVRAIFADIHVDNVAASSTPIEHVERNIKINWEAVNDVSGIKEYKVKVTESSQAPTDLNGSLNVTNHFRTLSSLSSRKSYYAWVKAVDNAGNISKDWLKIGPFSPTPENPLISKDKSSFSSVNGKPYYKVELDLKDVDANKFTIQRQLNGSTEWINTILTYDQLQRALFKYIDCNDLVKHAQYRYKAYTENALGKKSTEVIYGNIVLIPNIPAEFDLLGPADKLFTNKLSHAFNITPKTDIEGDEVRFRVLYQTPGGETQKSSESLQSNEVTINFGTEGTWEWWLEIGEYYKKGQEWQEVSGSKQFTETRTLFIDRTEPSGSFVYKLLTNDIDIKLSNIDVNDQKGIIKSGVAGIYLWNGQKRPGGFHKINVSNLPGAINDTILSDLATGVKGIYLFITPSLEKKIIEQLPWRLLSGDDGERIVSMEVVDSAGNTKTISKTIILDKKPPGTPTSAPCTLDGSKLVFNWYLIDEDKDLDTFCVITDGREIKVAKILDKNTALQYNGSYGVDIDYEKKKEYNKLIIIKVYATDLAGNKSIKELEIKGYTKAKLGEAGDLIAGYNQKDGHYFTLPVTGGIAKEQTLELAQDPNFVVIKKTVGLGADGKFVVTKLTPHGVYYYRLVATNEDGVRTVGAGVKYNVPNQPPPKPENLSPKGYASTNIKFFFNKVNTDYEGDNLEYQVYWDAGENNGFVAVDWDEQQACFALNLAKDNHGKTYTWYVEVDDGHGAIVESDRVKFVLDTNPPVLTLKRPDTIFTNQEELEFGASDDLSGLQKIECQITGAGNKTWILDPTARSIPLPEGFYHLAVTATDRAGNQTTENLNNLQVDRTPPQLADIDVSLPNNGSVYLTGRTLIPLTWKTSDDFSGINGLLYWARLDPSQPLGEPKHLALSPNGGSYALSLDLGAAGGRYYLTLAALDRAGNRSETKQIAMPILLDTTPPEVVFEVGGLRSHGVKFYLTSESELTIIEIGQKDQESGIGEKSLLVVDTCSNQVISESTDWAGVLATAFLSGKSYQILYRVANTVGLSTEARSLEFAYDPTAPAHLSLKLPQAPLIKGEIASFLAAATEEESRIVKYRLGIGSAYDKLELSSLIPGNLDGWVTMNTSDSAAEFRVEIPEVNDGRYYVTLLVENAAGLKATLNAGTIIIDNHQERVIVNDQGPYTMFGDEIFGSWNYAGTKEVKAYRYRLIDENGNTVPNGAWRFTTEQSATLSQLELTTGHTYRIEAKAVFVDDAESASGFSLGVTVDTTEPLITVLETPKFTTSWNLAFRWEGGDSQSGISRIQAALGSNYNQTDVTKGWVDLIDHDPKLLVDADGNRLDFDLSTTNRYYLTFRLVNGAGLATELASPCIIIDDTPPPPPVVVDQGAYINTSIYQPLEAHWLWTPEDKESGNADYEYAILRFGESISAGIDWRQGDESKRLNLSMKEFPRIHGETYYIAVKVTNGAGLSTIGYSNGIMVDESAPILTKVVLLEGVNRDEAVDVPEVNYITDNNDLHLWIESFDPESLIDSYLYTWGEQEQVDENERLISEEDFINLEHPEIAEDVVTVFLGETKNGAEIESATGYTTGVILDTGAPKICSVRGCLSGDRFLFDWEVEESASPVIRYEYLLVTEAEYSQIDNDENYIIPWKSAPDRSRILELDSTGIDDGRYYLIVRGFNAAGTYSRRQGKINEWGISPLIIVDRTPPVILEEEFMTPRYVDKVLTARVGAEDTLSGIHSYQYAVGNGTDLFVYSGGWVDVENKNAVIDLPAISTAHIPHRANIYLMARAKDKVGLWSEAKISPVIIVDHTKPAKPEVTCGRFMTDKSKVAGISFVSKDPESGLTHYQLGIVASKSEEEWLYTELVGIKDNSGVFSDIIFDNLALKEASIYYLAVKTRNGAGAWSETGFSASFLVDTISPEITFIKQDKELVLNQPPLEVEYGLTEDAKVEFTVIGADGSLKLHTVSGKKGQNAFSFNESIPQKYILRAKPTDPAGNIGVEKERLIRVNAPPQITLPSEIYTTPGAPTRFTASIYDPDGQEGDTFEYLWDPGDESGLIIGNEPEHLYNNEIKDYFVELTVKDKDGGIATATMIVKVRNTSKGSLYMDEIWRGEHRLYSEVIVPKGIILTIIPGAVVIVDGIPGDTGYDYALIIKGSLEIDGGSQGVTFRSITGKAGGWKGIYLAGWARINGLLMTQAYRGLTVTETADLIVTNSIFRNNLLGIHCYGSIPFISDSSFIENTWYGIKEDAGGRPEVRDCLFRGNGIDYYDEERTALTSEELNAISGNAGNQIQK